MKIADEIRKKQQDLYSRGPIAIAFLGDSVTQGCFECYEKSPNVVETKFYPEKAYCEKVKSILATLYPSVPVAVINAGISGGGTESARARLERDVLTYRPDLTVVCLGLNDVGLGEGAIGRYTEGLKDIFGRIKSAGSEVIFMTPNPMNYTVSPHLKGDFFRKDLAEVFAGRMESGLMDKYMEAARTSCRESGVKICDCYALWQLLRSRGVDTTDLLANYLNHPVEKMHWMFAYELVKTMLAD